MRVPINAPLLGRRELSAAAAVLKEGALTSAGSAGGRRVQELEKAAASFTGSKYAVVVNSGTAALQAGLLALGVKQGDEVLLPSFTFVATANAVATVGAKPVFVDIGRGYAMDPADLEAKITRRSRAAIPVHLYGGMAPMGEIKRIARKSGLAVLEDAAQALGSALDGRHAGTIGDAGCYSLYPAKVLTSGEGGIVVTGSKRIRDRLRMIRNHGMVRGNDTRMPGMNLRMPEVGAAIAVEQFKRLPGFLSKRRRNAGALAALLKGSGVLTPSERPGERANWYLYTIEARGRGRLMGRLNAAGYGAAAYYPVPVHRMPYYKDGTSLPATERAAGRVLSLPIHPGVTRRDLEGMARIIRGAAR
ncbi:pyridoxal phosphate-dependent enzyme [Cenarchaeum symbiosum A]|uniref:Pyridoxal phosphate-dependent enzyme n=1 Tax=Cenarchaeum symbiosum (strain A) TaxID=414004 RepID=A0RXI6_CENSY|nr:pyridoxal phosphate-dependent enzyme [Cenarchaeum symbiosum A]